MDNDAYDKIIAHSRRLRSEQASRRQERQSYGEKKCSKCGDFLGFFGCSSTKCDKEQYHYGNITIFPKEEE